jgi:DNA polymerase-1
MSKILIIDGHNFMYRARAGFQLGDFNVVYNFVRNLRSLVELMKPTRVYFTLEGAPRRQLQLLPEYKANRIGREGEAVEGKRSEEDYRRQNEIIVRILTHMLPVTVVQHPDFEADDLIYNLVKRSSSAIDFTVVSTDTDFIQMLQEFGNVKLYNPITKKYVEAPEYDYVTWKSLRGDGSDNIPSLPGIGDVRATELATDLVKLQQLLESDQSLQDQFVRNTSLIALYEWTDEEALKMRSSGSKRDWQPLREQFESMAFKSMLKEGTWDKFVATFDPLWGPQES